MKTRNGFTLIELLVVIAIIAILAGLVIARVMNASGDARDARRKSDASEIAKAFEIFKIKGGKLNSTVGFQEFDNNGMTDVECTSSGDEGDFGACHFVSPTESPTLFPRNLLSGDKYPTDPGGETNYWYDICNHYGCQHTIRVYLEDGSEYEVYQ